MTFSNKQSGQSFAEYGLVGALIVVVAIPAVMLLSTNVQSVVTGILPPPSGGLLASAPAGPQRGGGLLVSTQANPMDGVHVMTQGGADGIEIFYDTMTGIYTVPVLEANGGGTTTASVEDHQVLQMVPKQLSKLADDKSLPVELRNDIHAISHQARLIQNAYYSEDTAIPGRVAGMPASVGGHTAGSDAPPLPMAIKQYAQQYASLQDKIQEPAYAPYKGKVVLVKEQSAMLSHFLKKGGYMKGVEGAFASLSSQVREG